MVGDRFGVENPLTGSFGSALISLLISPLKSALVSSFLGSSTFGAPLTGSLLSSFLTALS